MTHTKLSSISKILMATGCLLASATFTTQAQQTKATPIFDGKTLAGWKTVGGKAPYVVENGVIVGTMTKKTPNSFLVTEKEYGDFILELEVKLEGDNTNSGIQIRSHIDPQANDGRGRMYGKQVEVDPTARAWTGGIYDEARRGWLYPLDLNQNAKKAFRKNEYNAIRIEAIGDEVRTWVNGIPTAAVIDTIDRTGYIGLQVHNIADADDGKKVYFKNVRIQTENLKSKAFPKDIYITNLHLNQLSQAELQNGYKLLFDGKSTAGWHSARGKEFPSKGWEIKNGTISVLSSTGGESTNGGDIVTDAQYKAFDLTFQFKLSPGANSGVKYFVTLNEQTSGSAIGLEYQVLDDKEHPDAKMGKNGNRTLASLYDLITSKKNARAVKPIGEWNTGRIVVYPDNRVEHYLNGELMVSYVRGSKKYMDLVAGSKYKDWKNFGQASQGHILLQDHGDNVSFRSIKIKELK
ncbi:3-keto-disaccharide hydrolase [Sphingobacterium spiritivorum]|uniref:3-keto-disaccharide hydrolase n=1 Tax=Sphingobacterium spiritivorum TaxID=258 RepID=UPI003DA4AFE3